MNGTDKPDDASRSLRQDRLERELRANLKRRKEQARARKARASIMDRADGDKGADDTPSPAEACDVETDGSLPGR